MYLVILPADLTVVLRPAITRLAVRVESQDSLVSGLLKRSMMVVFSSKLSYFVDLHRVAEGNTCKTLFISTAFSNRAGLVTSTGMRESTNIVHLRRCGRFSTGVHAG